MSWPCKLRSIRARCLEQQQAMLITTFQRSTTPQYNWSLPASLKNAIDYLFNEWKGKPGLIISYGGHGGGKCAAHLNEIMQGIRMRPTERMVQLAFPSREDQVKAVTGKDLGLSAEDEGTMWADKRKEIVTGFEELVAMLEK